MSTFGQLLQIQDYFTEITKENSSRLSLWITSVDFTKDEQKFLAEEICFISSIRPNSLDFLTTVVCNMACNEKFRDFRSFLINELLEKRKLIFMRKLLVAGVVFFGEIDNKVVGDDMLFFAPEFSLFDEYTEFEEHYEFGFPVESLGFAIKYDDENVMMSRIKGDVNAIVEWCPFEPVEQIHPKMNALETAALFGSKRCFDKLIQNGAKITDGVVDCAVAGGNQKIIDQLGSVKFNIDTALKYRRGQIISETQDYSFIQCIKNRNYSAAAMMFDDEPNKKDENGMAPLHYAVKENCIALVNFLVFNECDVNLLTNKKESALHFAVYQKNETITKILLKNGAKEIQDENGDTPLIFAVRQNEVEMCKLLLSNGANPNTKNNKGVSPLSIAKDSRNFELFGLLSIDK